MNRASWPVVFLASGEDGLVPERLQAGLFLLTREGVIPEADQYHFRPYLDGPTAFDLFTDLDELVEDGLLSLHSVAGSRWREFQATVGGRIEADQMAVRIGPDAAARVREVRRLVGAMPFRRLRDAVLQRHPEFAPDRAVGRAG